MGSPPQGMTNDYYGNYGNIKRFDQETGQEWRRERVITAFPNMKNGVEFGENEQPVPWCCIGTK